MEWEEWLPQFFISEAGELADCRKVSDLCALFRAMNTAEQTLFLEFVLRRDFKGDVVALRDFMNRYITNAEAPALRKRKKRVK